MLHDFLHIEQDVGCLVVINPVVCDAFHTPAQLAEYIHRFPHYVPHGIPHITANFPCFIVLVELLECRLAALLKRVIKLTDKSLTLFPYNKD